MGRRDTQDAATPGHKAWRPVLGCPPAFTLTRLEGAHSSTDIPHTKTCFSSSHCLMTLGEDSVTGTSRFSPTRPGEQPLCLCHCPASSCPRPITSASLLGSNPPCYLPRRFQEYLSGASLVAQWLRIRLPMQGTRVRALVREDPTCRGATKPCATTTKPAL